MTRYSLIELLYWWTFYALVVGASIQLIDGAIPQIVFCVWFLLVIVARNLGGVLTCVVISACLGTLCMVSLFLIVNNELAAVSNPPRSWATSTSVIVGGALGLFGGGVVAATVIAARWGLDESMARVRGHARRG